MESDPASNARFGRASQGAVRPVRVSFCTILVAVWALLALPAAACPDPPGAAPSKRCALIAAGVQANLDGRFTEAEAVWDELAALDPKDPAAPLWRVETAWWRLLMDDGATANDATVQKYAKRAIGLADARLDLDKDDPEALGQKGSALVHLARLYGVRGSYLKAGRTGERGRELLERSLATDPAQDDVRYALGLYSYYTSVMPGFLKWVSWLWFVPKGDRVGGLSDLGRVAAGDGDHSEDARFILMNINTYHAPLDLGRALELGRGLHARHPDNSLFHSELVEVLLKMGRYDEAITVAQQLEDSKPKEPEAQARPQLARILKAQAVLLDGRADEAWAILEPMDAERTRLPVWGGAWLHLVRGQVHDARGERAAAVDEYQRVTKLEGSRYNRRAALIAEAGLEQPFDPGAYDELPMISAGPAD